jgi:hypothetical protein
MVDDATGLGLLADLLADPSIWAEPSPGLEHAIVRAVDDAQPPVRRSQRRHASRARHEPLRRRRLVAAALGAAAAVIAFAGGILAVSGGGGANTAYAAQLRATAVAPGARAFATIDTSDAGFRITLNARGLPRLPEGGYYAAWLKNRTGTVVPIGTFSSSDGTVTLWSGVSPSSFRTISVSVQAAGNAESTAGYRVLVGRVHAR